MIDKAKEFAEKSKGKNPASTPTNPKDSESYGGQPSAEINPGDPSDCANMLRSSYKAGTGKDIYSLADAKKAAQIAKNNGYKDATGVSTIAAAGTEIPFNQVKEGDALIFNNYSHIVVVTGNIVTDKKGNTISVTAIGSQNSTGPAYLNIRMDKSGSYEDGNSGYWSSRLTAAYRLPEINNDSTEDK